MKIVEVPALITLPHGGKPRSRGVHVSQIIRNIAIETGILDIDEDPSFGDEDQEQWWNNLGSENQLRIAMGLAWEAWYIPQLGHVTDHPGEMKLKGIYMTHDGESLDTVISETGEGETMVLAVHEIKLTYKSVNTVQGLSTQWMWLTQTKAYAKGLGTTRAYVHVLFVCGDYSWPIRPVLKVWRIDYTQEEINESWRLIQSYRDERMR
jgi:hypothetical protein